MASSKRNKHIRSTPSGFIGPAATQVFLTLCKICENGNEAKVSEVAKVLAVHSTNVLLHLESLEDRGLVVSGTEKPKSFSPIFNLVGEL